MGLVAMGKPMREIGTNTAHWPSVTVIVLNYNGLEHLEPCFVSLQALDYPRDKLELMLADNASADDSVSFVQRHFPEVRIVRHDRNYGFSKGNNMAAWRAQGQYVAFLNNDMRVDHAWLKELVKPLRPEEGIVCTTSMILDWEGQRIDYAGMVLSFCGHAWQIGCGEPVSKQYRQDRPVLAPCGGAMLIDRKVFLRSGGFDEDHFAYFEDTDLGWRLWVMGYSVTFTSRSVVYHRGHGFWRAIHMGRKLVLYERNALRSLIKNYDDENLKRVLPVALLLMFKRAHLNSGKEFLRLHQQSTAQRRPPAPPRPERPAAARPSSPKTPVYDAAYYRREAWHAFRQGNIRALIAKTRQELGRRWRRWLARLRWRLIHLSHDDVEAPDIVLSYVIAANDVVVDLPNLLEKRKQIQAMRRRSDQEILALFGEPFTPAHDGDEYVLAQEELARIFGIDRKFASKNGVVAQSDDPIKPQKTGGSSS